MCQVWTILMVHSLWGSLFWCWFCLFQPNPFQVSSESLEQFEKVKATNSDHKVPKKSSHDAPKVRSSLSSEEERNTPHLGDGDSFLPSAVLCDLLEDEFTTSTQVPSSSASERLPNSEEMIVCCTARGSTTDPSLVSTGDKVKDKRDKEERSDITMTYGDFTRSCKGSIETDNSQVERRPTTGKETSPLNVNDITPSQWSRGSALRSPSGAVEVEFRLILCNHSFRPKLADLAERDEVMSSLACSCTTPGEGSVQGGGLAWHYIVTWRKVVSWRNGHMTRDGRGRSAFTLTKRTCQTNVRLCTHRLGYFSFEINVFSAYAVVGTKILEASNTVVSLSYQKTREAQNQQITVCMNIFVLTHSTKRYETKFDEWNRKKGT